MQELGAIFLRYDVQKILGLRTFYTTLELTDKQVMLGTTFDDPDGYWCRAFEEADIALPKIRGHVFRVIKSNDETAHFWHPHDYLECKSTASLTTITPAFICELSTHLLTHNLQHTLGSW